MKSKKFWKFMMAGSVLGWLFIFYGAFFTLHAGLIKFVWWCVLLGWGIGHPLELLSSFPIAKEKGIPPEQAFVKTMIFGFTWWLPLKMGVTEN